MESLSVTSPSTTLLSKYGGNRSVSGSRDLPHVRHEICFSKHPKLGLGFAHLISPQIHRINPIYSSSSTSPDGKVNLNFPETQSEGTYQSKTVHVKFQLRRECRFGEQFLIVGNDPVFGLWDPSHGIPLEWTEGHLWTVELDVPAGKLIQFKFILRDIAGRISWQPGPDRIIQTWETKNTISVSEDWDTAESHKITEEDALLSETMNSYTMMVAENVAHPKEEQVVSGSVNNIKGAPVAEATNDVNFIQDKPVAIVAENVTYTKEKKNLAKNKIESNSTSRNDMKKVVHRSNSRGLGVKNPIKKVEKKLVEALEVEGPVLVPGLTPLPAEEEDTPNEVVESMETKSSPGNETKDQYEPELIKVPLHDEQEQLNVDVRKEAKTEMLIIDEGELPGNELEQKPCHSSDERKKLPTNGGVLRNDIQWGRKTLKKFLKSLGLR